MATGGTPHILTIGAATRDVFVQSEGFLKMADRTAPDGFDTCLPSGAKIAVEQIVFETGGGATNAAVTFSRFGLRTACVCRVGDDANGREVAARLVKEKVNVSAIQTDEERQTGYSTILIAGSGERTILVYRGASSHVDASAIPWKTLAPDWIYLTSLGGDEKALTRIFAEAKRRSIRIIWNPGNNELAFGLKKVGAWIEQCDILNLNREEAAALTDLPPRDLKGIIHTLSTLPRRALIVTDGAHGAYLSAHGSNWFAPALPAKRVNTTGAGDAFGSAFAAAAIKTGELEIGLRAGMLNATGVVTHMGAKAGILKRYPTEAALARVKIKRV